MKHIIAYHNPDINNLPVEVRNPGYFWSSRKPEKDVAKGDVFWVFSKDPSGVFVSHYYIFGERQLNLRINDN